MRKMIALALLSLALAGCGEFLPTIPKPNHRRTAPQPQPGASPTAAPGVRSDPLPQPAARPLVDRSRLDEPIDETTPEPAAATAIEPAPERQAQREPEPRSQAASAKQRLESTATNWRDRHAPKIELLDAGSEPREPLRFEVRKGHAETVTMTLGMGLAMKVGRESMKIPKLPKVRLEMRLYVTDVRRNGDIAYEAVVHGAEILSQVSKKSEKSSQRKVREALESATESLVGISGTGVVTAQGLTKSVKFHVPSKVEPEVKDFLDQIKHSAGQLSAPFPAEAVGAGAEWRVRTFVNSRGVKLTQIATYRVLRRDEHGASLLVKVSQLADKQRLSLPEMPKGAIVKLTTLNGRGNGRVVIASDRLGPVTSKLDVTTDFAFEARQGSQTQELSMSLALDLEVATGDLADGVRLTGGENGGPRKARSSRIVR